MSKDVIESGTLIEVAITKYSENQSIRLTKQIENERSEDKGLRKFIDILTDKGGYYRARKASGTSQFISTSSGYCLGVTLGGFIVLLSHHNTAMRPLKIDREGDIIMVTEPIGVIFGSSDMYDESGELINTESICPAEAHNTAIMCMVKDLEDDDNSFIDEIDDLLRMIIIGYFDTH